MNTAGKNLWVIAGFGCLVLLLGFATARAQAPDPDLNNDCVVNILDISLVGSCIGVASVTLVMPLGQLYIVGVIGVAVLLAYEQSMVTANDLSRVKQAFSLNGYVGILYLVTTAGAIYVG